mgnify:FL=1
MLGMSKTIVGDADSLIALVNKEDSNHQKARRVVAGLAEKGYAVVYPNTAILEAITALTRKLDLREKAELIAKQSLAGGFSLVWVDEEIQREALRFQIDNSRSKQNTIFDCLVIACLKKVSAAGIFSFDRWYSKLGFKLAHELI